MTDDDLTDAELKTLQRSWREALAIIDKALGECHDLLVSRGVETDHACEMAELAAYHKLFWRDLIVRIADTPRDQRLQVDYRAGFLEWLTERYDDWSNDEGESVVEGGESGAGNEDHK
jgi:hypothetical protein